MSVVLVDTSIWVAFFRGDESGKRLFPLLDTNRVCVNDLILSEIIPSLAHNSENRLIEIMETVQKTELKIVWPQIMQMQIANLRGGINKVGIPDLIIAQNALQNQIPLLTLDKHFHLMKEHLGLSIYED